MEEGENEDMKRKYPVLSGMNVPLANDFALQHILREIIRWNFEKNKTKTISVTMMNSVRISLVQIPKSSSATRAKKTSTRIRGCISCWGHWRVTVMQVRTTLI